MDIRPFKKKESRLFTYLLNLFLLHILLGFCCTTIAFLLKQVADEDTKETHDEEHRDKRIGNIFGVSALSIVSGRRCCLCSGVQCAAASIVWKNTHGCIRCLQGARKTQGPGGMFTLNPSLLPKPRATQTLVGPEFRPTG